MSTPTRSAPAQAVTAAQLAETLGLSRSTVSIVLRGDAERRKISPATVARVLAAAKKHNYVPNFIAQSLRRQRSGIVSVVVENFALGWCEALMAGVYAALEPKRYTPFVSSHSNRADRLARELEASLRRRDDAVILQPIAGQEELYAHFAAAGMKLVFVGDYPVTMPASDFAVWDAGEAARIVVSHLASIGRKRIGYVGVESQLKMSTARFTSYSESLQGAGLKVEPRFVVRAAEPFANTSALQQFLDEGLSRLFSPLLKADQMPDALFMMSDAMALPALATLARLNIRVPETVAIASLGDAALTEHPGIGLTTVQEPVTELGIAAAETAIALIDRPTETLAAPIQRVLSGTTLHVRQTTRPT